MDLSIKKLNVAPIGTNCYIVINNELKEAVIIDPGGDEKIIEKINEENIRECENIEKKAKQKAEKIIAIDIHCLIIFKERL